ncbi:putative transposable element [Trichonephila clavipes]|nr:putative transposable element [Trichonephila clavipes]
MITNFFIPELNNHDVQELWFQQDGATCHTARATIDLLKDTFGDRLISRFGPVNWPPRSCDLAPLDYFLWGYVKSLVYADRPQTLDHLEDNIRRVIADIWPQMLEKVIENWTSRLDYIRASRGKGEKDFNDDHREEIIDFVQSRFQECKKEGVETWMSCDAKDCGFQMLNENEIVTSVQEESDPVDDETDEDEEDISNESCKGSSNADAFSALKTAME